MASIIDITKPTAGAATTQSVRQNFKAARDEIEALQSKPIPDFMLHVQDRRPAGQDGGTSIYGSQIRVLNTIIRNTINGATLLNNEITLPGGTYTVKAITSAYAAERQRIRLVNTTDNVVLLLGVNALSNEGTSTSLQGTFIIPAVKNINLTQFIDFPQLDYGLGLSVNDTFDEIYADVLINKLA